MPNLIEMTCDDFTPLIGREFTVSLPAQPDAGSVELELVKCTAFDQLKASHAQRVPFSLIFHSKSEPQNLPQRIYRFENPELGAMEVFMVPVGRNGAGFIYQVSFS